MRPRSGAADAEPLDPFEPLVAIQAMSQVIVTTIMGTCADIR
jgi:hypothetical protein